MTIELEDYSPLEGELAAILRAVLHRCGGSLSIAADELPRGMYTIDVSHDEDGGVVVHLHEHGMMQ